MYYNKVEICGVNTAKLATLTSEEKRDLLVRTKAGDKQARQKLIDGNLRLVLSIIQRFTNRRENLDDLFQVGCIGLIKAVDNFNLDLDVKFSTYAVPMIIGEVRRYLRDNNTIRVSRSVRDLAYRALQARERLAKSMASEPTMAQIATELGEKEENIAHAIEAIVEPVSLYEPVYNDGGDALYLMDQITDEKKPDNNWLDVIGVHEAMNHLTDREKHILTLRFFQGRTQMEVAGEIGISQAQVSRLEKNALSHMRKHVGSRG